jgi:hypothetical protein
MEKEPFYGKKLFSNYVKVYIMSRSFKTENDVVLRAFSLKLCNLLTFGLFPILLDCCVSKSFTLILHKELNRKAI